jgi:hypothetical protein
MKLIIIKMQHIQMNHYPILLHLIEMTELFKLIHLLQVMPKHI